MQVLIIEAERLFLHQILKAKHLMLADRGTKYSSSFIPSLVKSDGNLTTSQDEVIKEFIDYYTDLLGQEHPFFLFLLSAYYVSQGPILSEQDREFLISPIDDKAIKDALFHIGDDKAPGLDGYTAAFFNNNWDIVKGDFLLAVHEFFRSGAY